MRKPKGLTFQIGFKRWWRPELSIGSLKPGVSPHYHDPSWPHDHGWRPYPKGGFRFDLLVGTFRRPVPKFWKREFWWDYDKYYAERNQATNPWNSGNYWFIATIPWMPAFFLSCSWGWGEKQPGFYVGFKTYRVDHISCQLKQFKPDRDDLFVFDGEGNKVWTWCDAEEVGNEYLCLSASVRGDMVG